MARTKNWIFLSILSLAASGLAVAQGPGGPPDGQAHDGFGRPPMERTFHDHDFGRWWNNPKIGQAIGLTDDEKKKMDDIYQQHKLNLIDLKANLEKAEVEMGPMIEADQPNETQVLAQIDKVAQARAELEKADARMLFDVRKTLTADQWQKLKALHRQHREEMMRHGEEAPRDWRHHDGAGPAPGGPPPNGQAPDGAAPQGPPPQGDAQDAPPSPGDGAPGAQAAPQM